MMKPFASHPTYVLTLPLLHCRNSTDTAYFQRLRPYPRVLLRRCNTQFKDYEKCPIGFGVVVSSMNLATGLEAGPALLCV
jgi:hypothetical protein